MPELQINLNIEHIINANQRTIQDGDIVTIIYDEMNLRIKGKAANVKLNAGFDFVSVT